MWIGRHSLSIIPMEVLAITIFISVLLVMCFVFLYLGSEHFRNSSCEQEALLPLDDGPGYAKPCQPQAPPATASRSSL